MAIGDEAAAAGLEVVPDSGLVKDAYKRINQKGDELAREMTARVTADNLKIDKTTILRQLDDPGAVPDGTVWVSWTP